MKLHYFQSPNFGDALSPVLIEKIKQVDERIGLV